LTSFSNYVPAELFGVETATGGPPRVFIAPARYVQGPGIVGYIGQFVASIMPLRRVGILASGRAHDTAGADVVVSMARAGLDTLRMEFGGECTIGEIDAHVNTLRMSPIGAIVGLGGGKTIDTAKAVAYRLGLPVIVVPTLASNDAPCSALSILYDDSGTTIATEFHPNSPALVVVDTEIIAAAPTRYLAAGMGDALATWYEAKVVLDNPAAVSSIGGRPSIAAVAVGRTCAQVIFDSGLAALNTAAGGRTGEALEDVVEVNTLLSGLGFESGGLAAAHAVAQSCSSIKSIHEHHLHGEMVAFGLLTQFVLLDEFDEARRVADFFFTVGLPVTLGQLSINQPAREALVTIAAGTVAFPTIANMPNRISEQDVIDAMIEAQAIGETVLATSSGRP